jgi:hypothetical protein
MRERQPSIAESLVDTSVLLDGRYRLDVLVRRSNTATIHLATHRNGSSAWLKLPVSAVHAESLAGEPRIATAIGSPLIVRDDGATPDGVPYLVLDPPDAKSVASLRALGRTGTRLPLARVMTAGDALARSVGSLHAMGLVTTGLGDEDVLVFTNGDVALLVLDALVPATTAGVAADVSRLVRVLSGLVSDVAEAGSGRGVIDAVLAAGYPEVAALQAAWRAGSPEPIELPARIRQGGFPESPSAPFLAAHDTPFSLSVGDEVERERKDSVIDYLRSGDGPSMPPSIPPLGSRPHDHALMYDPLSKMAEMPRLLRATGHGAESGANASRSRLLMGALIVVPLVALVGGAALLASPSSPAPRPEIAAAALEAAPVAAAPSAPAVIAVAAPVAPSTVPPAPPAPPEPPADELELNTVLRTDGAPPGRDVFIDGKVIGKTPLEVSVPCGSHTLQMVAGAKKQAVELPCGGERVVRYDAKGHWTLK